MADVKNGECRSNVAHHPGEANRSVVHAAGPYQPSPSPGRVGQARAKLKLVQMYIDGGMKDKAKEILTDTIREYPNTEAAKTAKTKLTELGG